jgi:peroxiredoxin
MKKPVFVALSLLLMISCTKQKEETAVISGNIEGLESEQLFLMEREGRDFLILDTLKVENGTFYYERVMPQPKAYYIGTTAGKPFSDFFLEKGDISITGNSEELRDIQITGTINNDLYTAYKSKDNELNKRYYSLYSELKQAREDDNQQRVSELDEEMNTIDEEMTAQTKAFVRENSTQVVSPYLMWRTAYMFTLEELIPVYKSYSESLKASEYAGYIKERIDLLSKVAVGERYIDFSMEDTRGNVVSLSEMMGKVTLVDFWASWCSPCRKENPNVVKAWEKYHEKGLEIVGVSFDRDHEQWLKAIADDNLTWHHVSDLSYWDNAAGKMYGIRSIPSNFLMDENGVILAWNLREEALQEKLAELFAE